MVLRIESCAILGTNKRTLELTVSADQQALFVEGMWLSRRSSRRLQQIAETCAFHETSPAHAPVVL
jgi:hypothetical protein